MSHAILLAFLTLLQTAPSTQTRESGLADDAGRLAAATTNEERFDAMTSMLRARNLPFTVEPFTIQTPIGREPRTEGRNIVVTLGEGTGDIVIGAHYDAVRLQDGVLSRGAVDNAASSVILARLAEALRNERLPRRIRIVWFDMEELGLIGSAKYVERHASDKIGAMLNLDINAYGDTILFGPSERPESAALRRRFVETCAIEDIPCVRFPQMPPGDDRSFVKAGIPTISMALLPGVEAHQLWLMMNAGANAGLAQGTVPAIMRTIHTAEDTPAKLDEASMARVQKFAMALVRALAAK
jgi:hypothetical protein